MKYFQYTCLLFLLLFLFSNPVSSQQLALKTYTVEDGLIQSSVYSIIQDKNGYIWFSTEGGVSKFNGSKFINFTTEDGLTDSYIWCIFQDSKNNIWFGSNIGGASKYNGKFFKNYTQKDGLAGNTILSIIEDHKGNIWFGSDGGGVSKLNGNKFQNFTTDDGLFSNTVRSIYQDSKNNIWFSAGVVGEGICKYDGHKFSRYNTKDGLVNDSVICIYEDNEGNLWFGSKNGISKFDGYKFLNYTAKDGLPKGPILAILQDREGILWFGSHRNGLYKFEKNKFTAYSMSNGLTANSIRSLLQDNRGDLWIGTSNGGVMRMPIERFIAYTTKDGLPANGVYAINQDLNGDILIGTDGGGLAKLVDNRIEVFNEKDGLRDVFISSVVKSNENQFLIGTQGGLSIFNGYGFTSFTKEHGLVDNFIYSVLVDRHNNYWIATDEGGISKYNNGVFKSYTIDNGLINNDVFSVFEDSKGVIWIGTSGGLSRIDGNRTKNFTIKDGLPDNSIFHIHEDLERNIWFCTQKGASKFDGTSFQNFTIKDGLSDNFINYLIDDESNIYIGTNKGINIIDKKTLSAKSALNIKIYTAKDGLISSECTTRGVFKDKDGVLWFGTIKGVIRFDPRNQPVLINPPIFITRLKVNDENRELSEKLDLNYTQNYLKFEFNAVSFAFPEKTVFKYRLEGIDNEWNETHESAASYPYLPPNKYTFRVIAVNGDGVESQTPAIISFVINPPFWATWWFRTIFIIVVISSIYMIYVIKTQQVKKRNIELAKMVRERTHELELEKNKSEELLHNILPASLVDELKRNGVVQPREFKNVSIMFTDFKGFTYIASVLPADKLVSELNEMFKEFDRIIVKYGLEKLKTIGDSYMVGAGLPMESDDHAVRIIMAGLEMQAVIKVRNETSAIKWEMRTGVHSGYVIAGVVGTKKFSYDIWGDTVNIASRMESAGTPGEINISAYTYMLVRDHFDCEYRGKVTAKGKGDLDMYFVKSPKVKKEQKTLPFDSTINN